MDRLSWLARRHLRWSKVRAIGKLPIAKLTVLMPLIGYLILFNEQIVELLSLSKKIFNVDEQGAGNITPRLYFIYFGLTSFGIGQVIYQAFCPSINKRWGDALDFVKEAKDDITKNYIISLAKSCYSNFDEDGDKMNMLRDYERTDDEYEKNKEEAMSLKRLIMYDCWYVRDSIRKPCIVLSLVFYSVGLLLLLIPSFEAFIKIASSFLSQGAS